ncbi:hypothetical protein KTF22_08295 [Burkholderia multivorans]|uniref:hypothetical protein n=1 Tax=Burkholderia multivorans TaxID=87883 RepID=UPI001C22C82F|nr:hypothetical protein [Burkholderia multivorans]MBU9661890.1 hypothetical protein [Burkholderia multivorans]
MYRIDDATAATSLPVPEAAGTEGFFTEGNPATGTPATKVRGSWLNMIQEELCSILAAAGIARAKTTYNQVNSALQKMYSPVVGSFRNLVMSVTAASATATLTADQIVVATALNGQTFILPSFNKTINLATTGAGGMDTGTAPVSGFVALYAIYNPTTGASALLATNAANLVPNVYGGGSMPAGYTASALLSVWITDASGRFVVGNQIDRRIGITTVSALSSSTTNATPVALNMTFLPKNAKFVSGAMQISSTSASVASITVYDSAAAVGGQACGGSLSATQTLSSSFARLAMPTPQQIQWSSSNSAGTPTFGIGISSYEI